MKIQSKMVPRLCSRTIIQEKITYNPLHQQTEKGFDEERLVSHLEVCIILPLENPATASTSFWNLSIAKPGSDLLLQAVSIIPTHQKLLWRHIERVVRYSQVMASSISL